jgi:hypothetical protein
LIATANLMPGNEDEAATLLDKYLARPEHLVALQRATELAAAALLN